MASSTCSTLESRTQRTITANWTTEHENVYIDIMIDHVNKGDMITSTFSRTAWKVIHAEFYRRTRKSYNAKQFRNKYNRLRQRYKNFRTLIDQSGFGWDPVTNNVTALDCLWDDYLKANPDAWIFKTKGCPAFSKLCIIFGDTTTARGFLAWSVNEDVPLSPRELEDSDSDYVEETQNPRTPASVTPTPTVEQDFNGRAQAFSHQRDPTSTVGRRRKSLTKGDSIADAINNMADVAREKYCRSEFSLSRNVAYSITNCMDALGKIDGISMECYMKATEKFQVKSWRETFICMDDAHRKWWLEHLE